jgi:hypothetical protein
MIEVDAREFHGDRELLTRFLREKLKVQTRVHRGSVLVGGDDQPGPHPSIQEVKDLVKRALHHMRMDEYHVVTQSGVITIRERKVREHHARRRGSVPSAQQSVPYFFPG